MSSGEDVKTQQNNSEPTTSGAQQPEQKPTAAQTKLEGEEKPSATTQPLAPPPKPSQQNNQSQPTQTPDYFGGGQGGNAHFSLEPNPFEQSFGNPSSSETSGKGGVLPSVATLTSPAPLGANGTPQWPNSLKNDSLRSGPLSPAMLQGPVNANSGYFDQEFRNNYPTPNESSLRTGLTPGGGGSMFPAPSPNTAAIFNLAGGVTPGTAEFQRAAAAARQKSETQINQTNNTNGQSMSKQEYQPAQQQGRQDPFGTNQQEHEAVNSLYMLAGNRGAPNANQFAASNQPQGMTSINMQQRMQAQQEQQQQQSPTMSRGNGSIDMGQDDDIEGEDEKPSTRGKGKKGSGSRSGAAANGRRKNDETPSKAPPKKRSRGNNGSINSLEDDSDDDDGSLKDESLTTHPNGKKMTDEEKRKNFLERNRVAALKCRQRKKQWLANLQTKVELFTQENDHLTQQCSQLREEIINLKTLLLAHKDCPVSHQQGIGGAAMAQFMGTLEHGSSGQAPYGIMSQGNMQMGAMQAQGQAMQQGMQPSQGVQRS